MISIIDWLIVLIGIPIGFLYLVLGIRRRRSLNPKVKKNGIFTLLAGIFLLVLTSLYAASQVYIAWAFSP